MKVAGEQNDHHIHYQIGSMVRIDGSIELFSEIISRKHVNEIEIPLQRVCGCQRCFRRYQPPLLL